MGKKFSKSARSQRASAKVPPAPQVEQSEESDTKQTVQPQQTGMSARCRLALQKSHRVLMRDLDVKRTTDYLFSMMILTLEDKHRIQDMPNDNERRTTLLDILPKRGQEAYDQLCIGLSTDQPWLRETIAKNHDNITESDLATVKQNYDQRGATSTAELVHVLRGNLKERMTQWKTALELAFPDQEGPLPYIDQPCVLEIEPNEQSDVHGNFVGGRARMAKLGLRSSEERTPVSRSIKLVEDSKPGERITLYGPAGMGKTTLLKEIARSWVERSNPILVEKFTFMFLIPLRFVGKASLLNILCDELKLFPTSSLGEVEKSLHRNERETIFLLDSYEELRLDVIQEDMSEIGDLISGRLFPRSTVVVTSRPGYPLKKSGHQKIAQLEDLPEDKIKKIIVEHVESQDEVDEVLTSFPALSSLQKPINFALFLFIIRKYKHLTHSYTQAGLFSVMLQYIMLAFAKKKQLPEFTPQPGLFLANKNIHRDVRRLFRVLAKKCYDEMKEMNGVLHVEDPEEYLEFGLFTEGSESNTVVLPHPLFQEFFAAVHLAENPRTWTVLFEKIREQSESQSPKSPLIDIVRPMGLDNVVRFVMALSPQVCEELASLFVVERKEIEGCNNYQLVNFEYYAELLRDSNDERGKRVLATALLKAPVVDVTGTYRGSQSRAPTSLSYHMIDNLDYPQCVTFLKRVHNLDLCYINGKLTLSSAGECKILEIRDFCPIATLYKYDCHIHSDKLIVRGEYDCLLDVPSSMLQTKVLAVSQLDLKNCMLHANVPERDKSVAVQHSESSPVTHSSLGKVYLSEVKGLERCDVIMSRQCHLDMFNCDDVRVRTMKTCFPQLSQLDLKYGRVVAETREELMSWLSSVQSVRALGLAHIEGEPLSVSRQLSVWAEREELEYLLLSNYTVLLNKRDLDYSVRANKTLTQLVLSSCTGDVDLVQLFEVCNQCLKLTDLSVFESQIVLGVRDTHNTVSQNNTLSKLWLSECKGEVDLGALFEACSQCLRLTELEVSESRLVLRVEDTSDTHNNTLSELTLSECKGEIDLGALFEACSQCQMLTELTVSTSQLVARVRYTSSTVTQNNTLSKLTLITCKAEVDLAVLFEACSQCLQLTYLIVFGSQFAIRVRETSDTASQNNTLSELWLGEYKGGVDLGEVFKACSHCQQLTELRVFDSQLVVRVGDTSSNVIQNNTLSRLTLSKCKGEVDLGALFEACSQCLQLAEVSVYESQLVIRVGDTRKTVTQNNTLSKLTLNECKGEVDLGEVFEACSQCQQLTELCVQGSQVVVGVGETRKTVTQNNTLSKLTLDECKAEVDLGALFEACSQCQQLTELRVQGSQVVVGVGETRKTVTQNNTLSKLTLDECKAEVDLGALFEACSQCQQLTELRVQGSQVVVSVGDARKTVTQNNTLSQLMLHECKAEVDLGALVKACNHFLAIKEVSVLMSRLVLDDKMIQSVKQLSGLQQLALFDSSVHTPAGQRLSAKEVKKTLRSLCPSADVFILDDATVSLDTDSEPDNQ